MISYRPIYLIILIITSFQTTLSQQSSKFSKLIESELVSDTIDVLHYDINLDIVHISNKSISGFTGITITPKINNVTNIALDLLTLNVDSIIADNDLINSYSYNDTLLNIPLSSSIDVGDTIEIVVYYHGQPQGDPTGWGGFYFLNDSSYAFNLGVGFGADPHNYGRIWFPCLDEFVSRATYDIHIRVKDTKSVVSCGSLMSVTDNGDSTLTYHWKLHNSAPTYLIGMAIGNYVAVTDTFYGINGPVPTYVYVRPSDTIKAKASFVNLIPILHVYENAFGPYQWERVGFVGIPFERGAMEHTTNISYPFYAINGNLEYEGLLAHELAHQWFGDLVTCSSAEDMWLNEGWAEYCETFYQEGIYGRTAYQDHFRSDHRKVLQFTHIEDDGYRALYGLPHDYTYGSTAYDKGSSVVHTLRGYLGDSLFFDVVKANLSQHAFDTISSIGLQNFISTYSGIDMSGFFDAWVFSPGFPHFSVDSFTAIQNGPDYDVTVYMRQKYKGGAGFADANRVELTFMNNNWVQYSELIEFSGQHGSQTFQIPFEPVIVMADLNELLGDATIDRVETIKDVGNVNFPQTYGQVEVTSITDSAFVRIEHNWVAPDPLKKPNPDIMRLSDYRYWKVDGIFPAEFIAMGKFYYNRTKDLVYGYLDNTLLPNISPINPSIDSLLLLYRRDASDDWELTKHIRSGSLTKGYMICDTLKKGEYTFAVGTPVSASIENSQEKNNTIIEIYPNPSNGVFNINFDYDEACILKIYGVEGNLVDSIYIAPQQKNISWEPRKYRLPYGTYFLQLLNKGNEVLGREKLVFVRY